jgi:hypothetical protein
VTRAPVTLGEHILKALLDAQPSGLAMAAIAPAVAGHWQERDVEAAVRRLWAINELARRPDGTFVVAGAERPAARPPGRGSSAVGKPADDESQRRGGPDAALRVLTVDPGLLRPWCPTCRTTVTARLDGACAACGTQTGANLDPGASKTARQRLRKRRPRKGQAGWGPVCPRCGGPKSHQAHACQDCRGPQPGGWNGNTGGGRPLTHATEELLHAARRLYAAGLSMRQVAAELHPQTSYATVATCAEALYRHFRRRGWKLRPQRQATAARSHKHGRKPRQHSRAEHNAYRRWLAEQRGWSALHGPGRPLCKGVKRNPPDQGAPCGLRTLEDSDYCYAHDPRRELQRQAATARARARRASTAALPAAPFVAWLQQLHAELGAWARVGERIGMSTAQAHRWGRGRRGQPLTQVRLPVVERSADHAGTTVAAIYGTEITTEEAA